MDPISDYLFGKLRLKEIGAVENGRERTDPLWQGEALLVGPGRKFHLLNVGGAGTLLSNRIRGGERTPGFQVIEITDTEAFAWMHKNSDPQ